MGDIRLFVSHAHSDREIAVALVKVIEAAMVPRERIQAHVDFRSRPHTVQPAVLSLVLFPAFLVIHWLLARQDGIEAALGHRHLAQGGMALFDLSSSWVEGSHCELAAFGHSRDAEQECAAFHKRSGRIIKLLTVQEILDEEHVQKM